MDRVGSAEPGAMNGGTLPAAQAGNRFANWPRHYARAALIAVAALLIAAILTPITHTYGTPKVPVLAGDNGPPRQRDADLSVYDAVTARIAAGEGYYPAVVDEHRKIGFPLRPGFAVRLPTLVQIHALLGERGMAVMAVMLMLATLLAWWRRLGTEPVGEKHRLMAMALLFVGVSTGLNSYFFQLHELWAGMLLALAFALHRPGKWGAALAVAALALAIREHALPFVLLMAALAAWRRNWREAAAWSGLVLVFALALSWHLQQVAGFVLPSDGQSAPWLVLRGLTGWLSDVVLSSNLRFLPHPLANALAVLALLGWAGWKSSAGLFGTLLYAGYAVLFMAAGRVDNYYWGAMIGPALFIGLAFTPMAVRALWQSAMGTR